MGSTLAQVQEALPGLLIWLRRVFWVMGGYIFTTGLLTVYVALTAFRSRARGAASVVAVSGFASIGLMVVVNFVIASDFRWLILSFALPWAVALVLHRIERSDA